MQTAATSAGGLTSLFVAAVPGLSIHYILMYSILLNRVVDFTAMYHLGLMKTPKEDIGRLFLLTSITAFYGLFFAIPLRKYYIRESSPFRMMSRKVTSVLQFNRSLSSPVQPLLLSPSALFTPLLARLPVWPLPRRLRFWHGALVDPLHSVSCQHMHPASFGTGIFSGGSTPGVERAPLQLNLGAGISVSVQLDV